MLTISKPLSAGQAQSYHTEEFGNARENYYTEAEQIRGEWHGRLAEQWGLRGEVREEHFQRLSEGQHPTTGKRLIRHQAAREYMNRHGEKVSAMEHRAGWDATFSAPKSVSLTALVGRDDRVREAHRESVGVALDELERYVQSRIGGNLPAETTGKWVAAKFEHDSARPVNGYAAPQLHTHVVFFNVTETAKGETHSLQPHELFRSQQYATAVYRSELALCLKDAGYEIEQGKSCQPEIKGYTREYLEASSPRSQQIKDHLEQQGLFGAAAAEIAAHQTRDTKLPSSSHEEMQEKHREMAAKFGNQPEQVVSEAQTRQVPEESPSEKQQGIESALTYSRDKNFERQAVVDERDLMRDSLRRSMGYASLDDVKARFEERVKTRDLIERENKSPGRAFTSDQMIRYERDTIEMMRSGKNQGETLASPETRHVVQEKHSHLSENQRTAVDQILSSQDRVTALEGTAGAGKTTALAAVREAAEREGYEVRGLAPTSRAAHKLGESGIESGTLQRHLRLDEQVDQKRLYILDESSLASTKQMNGVLHRMQDEDRVILVGDKRQHEAVEAGRPYQQMQEAGMQTARLDEIVRQKDPELKQAVEQLSRGHVFEAVANLEKQGRVHEIVGRDERLMEIAREYAQQPRGTLVISPDNESRRDLNELIHRERQERGYVHHDEHKLHVPKRELGTIERINDDGDLKIRMDSAREIEFNIREHPHLDHGYAVTSHSSQGQTADRVLVHVDTDRGEQLVNNRFAYVSVSRGQYDAQIYTNDRDDLPRDLARDLSRKTATDAQEEEPAADKVEQTSTKHEHREQEHEHAQAIGLGVS